MPPYKKLTAKEKAKRRKARRDAIVGPPKVGRPRAPIATPSLEKMAEMQCTNKEIAAVLGVHVTTFLKRLRDEPELQEAVDRGRERGKVNLRMLQMRHAEGEGGPAVNMAIHLSKHTLGQFDKPTNTHSTVDINVEITSAGDRIAAKLDELRQRMLTHQLPQLEVIDVSPVPECVESGVVEHASDRGTESVRVEPVEDGAGGA